MIRRGNGSCACHMTDVPGPATHHLVFGLASTELLTPSLPAMVPWACGNVTTGSVPNATLISPKSR
ncbi:hypothetical protein D3C81_1362720 [compost metagenome]